MLLLNREEYYLSSTQFSLNNTLLLVYGYEYDYECDYSMTTTRPQYDDNTTTLRLHYDYTTISTRLVHYLRLQYN